MILNAKSEKAKSHHAQFCFKVLTSNDLSVIQPLPWYLALNSVNKFKIIFKVVSCYTSRKLIKLEVAG